jgi:hypothetical protein
VPLTIQQWAATAAGISAGIGLNELITRGIRKTSPRPADHTEIHRAFAPKRVTENNRQIADPIAVGVAQKQGWEWLAWGNLQDGKIGMSVLGDDMRH